MLCVVFLGVLHGADGDVQVGVSICHLSRRQSADEVVGIKSPLGRSNGLALTVLFSFHVQSVRGGVENKAATRTSTQQRHCVQSKVQYDSTCPSPGHSWLPRSPLVLQTDAFGLFGAGEGP